MQFGCARWVWNEAFAGSQKLYRETGKGLNYYAMAMRLPVLKKEFDWLKEADAQVLQQSLQHLARAMDNFFQKRAKFPNFKSKRGKQSISYPQRVKIVDGKIYLPKVGWTKCVVHREIEGKIKTVTVSRNAAWQYHAAVLTDNDEPLPEASADGNAIGVDVGLNHIVVTSDGSKFDNPRHTKNAAKNLARKQRKLARKKKGSKSRHKAARLVARVHQRIADTRRDHLHKLSRRIVDENKVIAVEDLYVKGMMRNHHLAKAIADAGWSMFSRFLKYKAERAGSIFIEVDRWYPSSKTCSDCGALRSKIPLDIRSWSCTECGVVQDRDVNAARNIRDEGLRILAAGAVATASGGCISHALKVRPSVRAVA